MLKPRAALVVHSNPVGGFAARARLMSQGWAVEVRRDVKSAIESLQKRPVQLVAVERGLRDGFGRPAELVLRQQPGAIGAEVELLGVVGSPL